MSYDNPNRQTYTFGNFDFGAGADEQFNFVGPKGKKGRIFDYGVMGTIEVMNGSSTTPKVSVGNSSSAVAYGSNLDINALADNTAKSVRSTVRESVDGSFTAYMTAASRTIPADTQIRVNCIGAAGSPTGQAVPFVTVDWDD